MSREHPHIEEVINAFYRLISGSQTDTRDWEALCELFANGAAVLSYTRSANTEEASQALPIGTYIERLRGSLNGRSFFERGLDYRITIHGDIAQVCSRYEAAENAEWDPITKTGTNLIHLVRQGSAWRIAGMVYQNDA